MSDPSSRTVVYHATLCPGHGGHQPRIGMRPITTRDEELANQRVELTSVVTLADQTKVVLEQIRLTIVSIDGEKVGYNDLQNLDRRFTAKQIIQLRQLFQRINNPDEQEVRDFLASIETSQEDGGSSISKLPESPDTDTSR